MIEKRKLSDATIRFDSNVRGPEENGIFLFSFVADDVSTWFEMGFDFVENRNDYWATIRNFGLLSKALAGSKTPDALCKFNAIDKIRIAKRIEQYFIGPEEKKSCCSHAARTNSWSHFFGRLAR